MKTNIKMKVTPEQSRKVQEIVFANGGSWVALEQVISNEDMPYLFLHTDASLTCSDMDFVFEIGFLEEISAELFIRTNGTCIEQEEPKQDIDLNKLVGIYWETSVEDSEAIYDYLVKLGFVHGCFEGYSEHIEEFQAKFIWTEAFDFNSGNILQKECKQEVTSLQELKEYISSLSNPTQKEYLIYVQGKGTPKKKHDYESAINEAKRLSEKEIGREVHVVEIVKTFQSKVTVEEV